jgi:hypothetical protein
MRFPTGLFASILLAPGLLTSTAAIAQTPPVMVGLGPAVQARESDLGHSALDQVRQTLAQEVGSAAVRSKAPISRVELVIQDIQPNRPTSAQLGRSASLSPNSYSLGGAAVTGVMTIGGEQKPIRFRYFQTNPRDAVNFDTWGDASQAFEMLSDRIAKGEAPYDEKPWPPPHKVQQLTGTRIGG